MLSYQYKSKDETCNEVWRQWDAYCWYWFDECEEMEMAMWHVDPEEGWTMAKVNIQTKKNKIAK